MQPQTLIWCSVLVTWYSECLFFIAAEDVCYVSVFCSSVLVVVSVLAGMVSALAVRTASAFAEALS